MKFDIALVSLNREKAFASQKASATYTFAISNGNVKAHAEVILVEGGSEVIERKGKDSKVAARLALERLLVNGSNPFESPLFVRIPYQHAEYFSRYGNFHQSFRLPDMC
jgi:hypothetical protein